MAEDNPPVTSPRPEVRPTDKKELTNVARGQGTDHRINMTGTSNPLSQLGATASDEQFQVLNEKQFVGINDKGEEVETVRGAYIPPATVGGVEYMGGDIEPGVTAIADWMREVRGGDPEYNDVFVAGSGLTQENGATVVHEFMHRGVNMLKGNYTRSEMEERYGFDAAQVLFSDRLEHPLIQAMLQTKGNTDLRDYMTELNMDDSERQQIFRALNPITELALEALDSSGYKPPPTAPESPEREANRMILQMERAALEEQAETFLGNLLSLFGRGN